eukprot:s140_g23.t1
MDLQDRSVSLGDPSFRSQLHRLDGLKSTNVVPGPGMYEHNPVQRVDGKATWRQLRRGCALHMALRGKTPPPTPREEMMFAGSHPHHWWETGQLYVAPTKAPPRRLLCTVPQKEQRIVSRQPMKSLLSSPGESIPSLSQEHVCIWIGTDSTQVPVRRHKMLGKVCPPSSAFASGLVAPGIRSWDTTVALQLSSWYWGGLGMMATSGTAPGTPTFQFQPGGERLQLSTVTALYSRYIARYGVNPPGESEPSIEQLSALARQLESNTNPYFDMAQWGLDRRPASAKTSFKSHIIDAASGDPVEADILGPDCLASWEGAFKLYIVAMALLGASNPDVLDSYREFVAGLRKQFGHPCWGIICSADIKMRLILKDVQAGVFDCVGVTAPSETLSPLREGHSDVRPLRSLDHPDGLGRKKLSRIELDQLNEANHVFELSASAVKYQLREHRAFWLESSGYGSKLDFWKTSWGAAVEKHALVDKVVFDQCMFGADTAKPTKIAHFGLDLAELSGIRCTHNNRTWTSPDSTPYLAKHKCMSLTWRANDKGHMIRASSASGPFPAELCRVLAKAMVNIDQPRPSRLLKMRTEALP